LSTESPILTLSDVRFRWPGRTSFELYIPEFNLVQGETVLLLGESGSGKSTLLSLICGTITPRSGHVLVGGEDMGKLSSAKRDQFRAEQIGLIFQQFNLLPFASVLDNIMLPLRFAPKRKARVPNQIKQATQLCSDLGLPNDILNSNASRLSVGQQQRVAAARALIGTPPLLIADEPTSALDAATQSVFLELLFNQSRANGTSLLMVSHDARLGDQFDRVVNMTDIINTMGDAT
jgi:putative ABC transport system ATP-binding protein